MQHQILAGLLALFAFGSEVEAKLNSSQYNTPGLKGATASAIKNENIKYWMTPSILFTTLVMLLFFIPLFFIWFCMMHSLQTPMLFPSEGIEWGKVEEVE